MVSIIWNSHLQCGSMMTLASGHALSWDEIVYDGEVEERKFAAFFVKSVSLSCLSLFF